MITYRPPWVTYCLAGGRWRRWPGRVAWILATGPSMSWIVPTCPSPVAECGPHARYCCLVRDWARDWSHSDWWSRWSVCRWWVGWSCWGRLLPGPWIAFQLILEGETERGSVRLAWLYFRRHAGQVIVITWDMLANDRRTSCQSGRKYGIVPWPSTKCFNFAHKSIISGNVGCWMGPINGRRVLVDPFLEFNGK